MAQRISEIMPTIMGVAKILDENSLTHKLQVTDHLSTLFGKNYHRFDFKIVNRSTGKSCGGHYVNIYMPEIEYPIKDKDVLDRINFEISYNYEWVIAVLDSLSGDGYIEHNWHANTIKIEDTLVKPISEAKQFNFEKKDDILEEYDEVKYQIEIEEKTLADLKRKKIGLAKEYYNRKASSNIGDIVIIKPKYEFSAYGPGYGVLNERQVYEISYRMDDKTYANDIEKDFWCTSYVYEITSSGKTKSLRYRDYIEVKRVCKESEFSYLMGVHGFKSKKLNSINLTKLVEKLMENEVVV